MKSGFTLSEVLITFGIIGVVAALTLPVIIQKQIDKANVAKLQKVYSTLSQALLRAKEEHGEFSGWVKTTSNPKEIFSYIKPYLNIVKECENRSNSGCWAEKTYSLSGVDNYWYFYDGQVGDNAHMFVLNDGISVNIDVIGLTNAVGLSEIDTSGGNALIVFDVDLNGVKGPNKWGRDIFGFAISNTRDKLVPFGSGDDGNCNPNIQGRHMGISCAYKVLSEKAINY